MKTKKVKARTRQLALYTFLVIAPIVTGILAVLLWKLFLYDNNLYFSAQAEAPILYIIMPPVGFIYVIFASIAVNTAFDKHKAISRSVVRRDIDSYLEHRDQRVPGIMHILVAMPSLVLMFVAMTYQYADFHAGVATVFLVTFVISTTWFVINELDNTHQRKNFREKTPEGWHDKKASDHFSEK